MHQPLRPSGPGVVNRARVRWVSLRGTGCRSRAGRNATNGWAWTQLPDRSLRTQVPTQHTPHHPKTRRVPQAELEADIEALILGEEPLLRAKRLPPESRTSSAGRARMLRIQSVVGPHPEQITSSLMGHGFVLERSTIAVIACGWPVLRPAWTSSKKVWPKNQPQPARYNGSGTLNTASARRPGRRRRPSCSDHGR